MKIYTKTGDKGSTSLVGGERTNKYDLRVWAYGSIDEANSSIGLARACMEDENLKGKLLKIQKTLFEVAAELASLGTKNYRSRIEEEDVVFLEDTIDELDRMRPVQNGFIVPGGTVESAHLDVARTDVRRAERYISELRNHYEVNDSLQKYVNRLSDAIYAVARYFDYKDILKKTEEKLTSLNSGEKIDCRGNPQKNLLTNTVLNRETAEYIAGKCIEKSYDIGVPMVICIVDFDGNVILLERMDNSLLISLKVAFKKAYTAAALKSPTGELYKALLPGGEFYGLNNDENIITFAGGFPLKIDGHIVGAIGVSGGTVDEDTSVSKYGVEVFEEVVKYGIKR
ncbi:cob(I)yrinic acid a,c-diamide adenosyltransferase [Clostridium sp. MT-14]|uniref:Corrinoid adenosyltransferase n=1 Tax=Clostridium aromativorans TaxID=2836848 RepID=A0ABS8N4W6_9CLOT|nr:MULTISPECIES: cob(I)yrinic acid a,c-diamide adenosyltransferase [Clostridium]KAA8676526.1 cob(I)yrinic acid a,c-diamide adenosyltransferase [Clostridium sp. HV4-5-A1G]MCC9294125.1 cob(I)yrinic acid a,c-diamide adenosyltransferase [Clostridium aromativorans]